MTPAGILVLNDDGVSAHGTVWGSEFHGFGAAARKDLPTLLYLVRGMVSNEESEEKNFDKF
jgi:hypothetical protein